VWAAKCKKLLLLAELFLPEVQFIEYCQNLENGPKVSVIDQFNLEIN
jgi:hypothetical protein